MSRKLYQLPKEALSADRSRFTVSSCVDRWMGPLTVYTFGAGRKAYYVTVYANHSTLSGMVIEQDMNSDDFGCVTNLPVESIAKLVETYNFKCTYQRQSSVNHA